MSAEQKLKELGMALPQVPGVAGLYAYYRPFGGNLAYISGCGPALNGVDTYLGRLGRDLTVEEGQEAAKNCMLNALAVIQANLGSLDKIKSVVKLLAFVASAEDFYQQPRVVNGASRFLADVLGEERGIGARSAIGVNVLPGNIPVEIELMIELR